MIHPDTELRFINQEIGCGLVATSHIPKGTVTWIMDPLDRVITPDALRHYDIYLQNLLEKYTFRDNTGNHILCWDHGRFINHSFTPNCMTTAYGFELAIYDIQPGEELTNDYGTLNLSAPFFALPETNATRHVAMPDDLLFHHKEWDQCLKSAFQRFRTVNQPLQFLFSEDLTAVINEITAGRCEMASILSCYCGKTDFVDIAGLSPVIADA